jgi:catalase
VSGKMELCRGEELIRRQIAIFREVDWDIATRLEEATGIKGYDGIAGLSFNGTHHGMAADEENRFTNGIDGTKGWSVTADNGAPVSGTHRV